MKLLILGAGGIGGYFGARLAAAGVDATFLVRPRRDEILARDGLVVKSPKGDLTLPVKTVRRDDPGSGYDAIVLSCKAYDLDDAIAAIRPAATGGAKIIPLLNGLLHLDALDAAFGAGAVLGGVAVIGVTLDPDGAVRHLNASDGFVFGERAPGQAAFCERLAPVLARGGFDSRHSSDIMRDMWEKFVFITTNAGMCSLMRGPIGAINATEFGTSVMEDMIEECAAVAIHAGFPPRDAYVAWVRKTVTDPASPATASMFRDILGGHRVEARHIVGDMLSRARAMGQSAPMLRAAYTHLQVYEAGRG